MKVAIKGKIVAKNSWDKMINKAYFGLVYGKFMQN